MKHLTQTLPNNRKRPESSHLILRLGEDSGAEGTVPADAAEPKA